MLCDVTSSGKRLWTQLVSRGAWRAPGKGTGFSGGLWKSRVLPLARPMTAWMVILTQNSHLRPGNRLLTRTDPCGAQLCTSSWEHSTGVTAVTLTAPLSPAAL